MHLPAHPLHVPFYHDSGVYENMLNMLGVQVTFPIAVGGRFSTMFCVNESSLKSQGIFNELCFATISTSFLPPLGFEHFNSCMLILGRLPPRYEEYYLQFKVKINLKLNLL